VGAGGAHAVPTRMRIATGGGQRDVTLPPVDDRPSENATVEAPVSFLPLTGSTIRITVTAIRPEETIDYQTGQRVLLPVAIAEAGLPGVPPVARPQRVPATCRADLVRVDGRPHRALHVSAADAGNRPFWLVLGQSQSSGWTAAVDGKDLGRPRLIDGYANGWVVRPHGRALAISLTWTPQRRVWIALALSAV